ncbi:hypothetical protein SAMN05660199_00075 [Klenkia soli]|uniref:Uncharacterized protein n=2 Tax=Klenkia soli TaxID=1052260 RepID=A0A1H0BP02_9ACTN|nr:hypothetical protein SAMN05660199_00075 [Klenkia soli]
MIIEARPSGGGEVIDHHVPGPTGPTTLTSMLETLASAELAGSMQRHAAASQDTVLTAGGLAEALQVGAVRPGARDLPEPPTPQQAVDRVLQAFDHGLVLAVLDGTRVTDRHAPVTVGESTRLRLVRLVGLGARGW